MEGKHFFRKYIDKISIYIIMKNYHNKRFPGESDAYREARNKLLEAEINLRRQTEEVAELRRNLPDSAPRERRLCFRGKGCQWQHHPNKTFGTF